MLIEARRFVSGRCHEAAIVCVGDRRRRDIKGAEPDLFLRLIDGAAAALFADNVRARRNCNSGQPIIRRQGPEWIEQNHLFQHPADFRGRTGPFSPIMLHERQDQAIEFRRYGRAKGAGGDYVLGLEDRQCAYLVNVFETAGGYIAVGQQFVSEYSQGIEIRALIYVRKAKELLGRHVFWCAALQLILAVGVIRRGQTEVHDNWLGYVALSQKDVCGLEIAMGNQGMGDRQGSAKFGKQREAARHRVQQSAAILPQPVLQVMTLDQVHDDPDAAIAFIEIVDWADVGMAQPARDQHLAAQRLDVAAIAAMALLENFDRQGNTQLGIEYLEDVGGPALPDRLPIDKALASRATLV